jgi:hydroxypyruvate isomerase
LNALYGNADPAASRDEQSGLAVENLAFAVELAAHVGARIVVEALNPSDFPAYGLNHTAQVQALIGRVRAETGASIWQQYDVYHAWRAGEDVLATITTLTPTFGHVQIADVPGRGQPGTGTIPFDRVLPAFEIAGYDRWIGLEYVHTGPPEEAFDWVPWPARRVGRACR